MTDYVFSPPVTPSIAVEGSSARFPLRRVFCVGRNYAAHAREMGKDPDREPPFFFMKPPDAVIAAAGTLHYPVATDDLHHEVELVVGLGGGGKGLSAHEALNLVWGYGVGIDLTRRDLQAVAKELSRPWDFAKGFDGSAPCSPLKPVSAVGHPRQGRIWLEVNEALKQSGDLQDMIWPVAEMISFLSGFVELMPGDLIFSGTPAGVGSLQEGDRVRGGVDGVAEFEFQVGPVVL